jgi:hypothetical protein
VIEPVVVVPPPTSIQKQNSKFDFLKNKINQNPTTPGN